MQSGQLFQRLVKDCKLVSLCSFAMDVHTRLITNERPTMSEHFLEDSNDEILSPEEMERLQEFVVAVDEMAKMASTFIAVPSTECEAQMQITLVIAKLILDQP